MKRISKAPEPQGLVDFKTQANDQWQPTYDGLPGTLKRLIHQHLLQEQGHLCCYCGCRVDPASSHIEHFRPQTHFPQDQLTYDNLLASCQRETQPGEPLHCGKLKDDWFDPHLLLSPLQPDCETRFRFTADGGIHPAQITDTAATETRDRLGLDISKLRRLRKGAIDAVIHDLPNLTDEDLRKLTVALMQRDATGTFPEFCLPAVFVLRGLLPT